ncbi:MAG TPA: diacylglycerol kinase [Isosphaeraceae bacterium]
MYRSDDPASNAVEAPNLMTLPGSRSADLRGATTGAESGFDSGEFLAPAPDRIVRAGRRNLTEKLLAGLVGIKHAVRGDSSFFAHAYRALLIFLTAGMIGVSPLGWCLLVMALGLVLVAELMHSAVDTLARAVGDPEEPRLRVARDIAAAGVLVTVVSSAAISIAVLTLKLGEYLGWWDRVAW